MNKAAELLFFWLFEGFLYYLRKMVWKVIQISIAMQNNFYDFNRIKQVAKRIANICLTES